MKKNFVRSYFVPGLIILVVGVFLVALSWLAYYGIYMTVETLFYPVNPMDVPASVIRISSAIALIVVYLLVFFLTKLPDLWKAAFMVAPLTMILIAVVLGTYGTPIICTLIFLFVVGVSVFLNYRLKKPWFYYYATIIAIIVSLLYAWPRP